MSVIPMRSSPPDHCRPPRRANIRTVAFPGVTSTRSQIARYCGNDEVIVLKSETKKHNRNSFRSVWTVMKYAIRCALRKPHRTESDYIQVCSEVENSDGVEVGDLETDTLYSARSSIGPRILHNVMPSPEVDEMKTGWTFRPLHWFMWLKELGTRILFKTELTPHVGSYCEAGSSCVGGTRDQLALHREVRRALRYKDEEFKHLVIFGCSRGATTCFYGSLKLPVGLAQRVSLVIVEAPFDTLENVMRRSSWFPSLARWFFRSFCDYRGEMDEQSAYDYNSDEVMLRCPIAFVMSLNDKRVPNSCTEALIDRVRRELVPQKVPAVEVLVLKHSRHPSMAVGNREDQEAYVSFVESLYDKYCR